MKSNTFNYSLLAVGVAAVMGLSTGANAADSGQTKTDVDIINVATAKYNVAGVGQEVTSNSVKITVSEQVSFSLTTDNDNDKTVAPNGFVIFEHRLTNEGNRKDNYTIIVTDRTDDTKQFDLTKSTITYRIYTDGEVPAPTTGIAGTISASNTKVPLESNQFAVITVKAKTNANKGGDTQNLDLTATGTALATGNKSVTNIDKSKTILPTFSIIKTISKPLDLNNNDDTSTYTIVISNPTTAFSDVATDIQITDTLPTGLVIAKALSTSSPDIKIDGGANVGTLDPANSGGLGTSGFNLKGASIPVGGKITITLVVKRAQDATIAVGVLNHVKVTDDLDNDETTTDNILIDSTDSTVENVGNFYVTNDVDKTSGTAPTVDDGTDYTQPLTTIKRALTLGVATTREIAPLTSTTDTKGQVTHTATITNNGQDIEGNTANPLTLTITDGTNAQVNPVLSQFFLVYTTKAGAVSTPIAVTPIKNDNVYTISSTQFPGGAGIEAGGKLEVRYNMESISNGGNLGAAIDSTEETVVQLTATGAGAPTVPSITDTTIVKGLTLAKSQLKDPACNIAVNTTTSFSTTDIAAEPGQCVIYQIIANNTFTSASNTPITNLVISDLLSNFDTKADYVDLSAVTTVSSTNSSISVPANKTTTDVTTTVSPLAATNSATLRFKIKIKTDRAAAVAP